MGVSWEREREKKKESIRMGLGSGGAVVGDCFDRDEQEQ